MTKRLEESELGRASTGSAHYDPSLLFPIARKEARQSLDITGELPFHGHDSWTAFEVSWLNPKGKPEVAVLDILIPCTSHNIVESKSFKLYFNSFNQHQMSSLDALIETVTHDLSNVAKGDVTVNATSEEQLIDGGIAKPQGTCLDDLDIEITDYQPNAALLQLNPDRTLVQESLFSHLFKSNCPVTNQPDWATVHISYHGPAICHQSLLQYLVSYRDHQGFHEWCVEQLFVDIMKKLAPKSLTVSARFTRRGGLDINPIRSTEANPSRDNRRTFRQ